MGEGLSFVLHFCNLYHQKPYASMLVAHSWMQINDLDRGETQEVLPTSSKGALFPMLFPVVSKIMSVCRGG
eukprot:c33376_g1_i1 orf=1-210(-)